MARRRPNSGDANILRQRVNEFDMATKTPFKRLFEQEDICVWSNGESRKPGPLVIDQWLLFTLWWSLFILTLVLFRGSDAGDEKDSHQENGIQPYLTLTER